MPKISVIVPVYNAERFLVRCIESILNQTYTDFELILINDGSSDNSSSIIKDYLNKDNRIIFINNQNKGVSETRNIGVREACGEYIQFVDSDDFIDKNMLKDTLEMLQNKEADMVITGLYLDIENRGDVNTSIQTFNYNEAIGRKNIALNVLERVNGTYINSPVNKLYKRKIIIDNDILMDNKISLGEDFLFNLRYLKFCNKVVFSDKCYYHYWMKAEDNLTFKFRENKLDLMYLMYKESIDYFESCGLDKSKCIEINNIFIKWMYSCFIDLHNNECNLTYNEKINYLKASISKYQHIICKTDNLSIILKILKVTLNYPLIVLITSKLIYIIKIKFRKLLYR